MEILTAVVEVAKEALAVLRAALDGWSVTARLCVILIVVTATTSTTALVLS